MAAGTADHYLHRVRGRHQRRATPVVVDSAIALGFAKRMGRLLNSDGRSVGCVPMESWTDPIEAAREASGRRHPENLGWLP